MGTVGAIATAVGVGLQMADKYIDDPKRRLALRQEIIDELKKKMEGILNETEIDALILELVSDIHNL